MKKKNVLVAGIGQTNYIFQLYGNIGPKLQNFKFNSINLEKFGNSDIENKAKQIFDENYQYKFNFCSIFQILEALLIVFSAKYFWKDHFVSIAETGWKHLKYGFYLTKRHVSAYHYAKFIDRHAEAQIIHVHFPSHAHALFINYLRENYQIILTYWGSDIFRISNRIDHEIQAQLLPTSTLITVATPEMKFALITRYGSGFEDKIRIARFIHDSTFYGLAHNFMQDRYWKTSYLNKKGIPENKKIILFGHNAYKENNHLAFLDTLKLIPPEILKFYHIIFPLTYPKHQNSYIKKIQSYSNDIPVTFTYLTEFLSWEDMAKLKIISDVYIHAPTTDGLSAFLTEFFYTNNIAIVGSWLPYKTFLKYGINYLEFNNFNELNDILKNLESNRIDVSNNKSIVSEKFNSQIISEEWLKVFKDLSN